MPFAVNTDNRPPIHRSRRLLRRCLLAAGCATLGLGLAPAALALVNVTVTAHNLAAPNGVAVAPLHIGFNAGNFDAFDIGQVAGPAIVSVAEGGLGAAWQAAFAAAEPLATRGTVGGVLLPGASASATFTVDPLLNPYFTFAAMVVPSNDFFIGNDSPTRFRLFDAAGNPQLGQVTQTARQLWDAGSEVFDPAAAAFVGNNNLRAPQNSVVAFNFAEFAAYNGLTTAAGYVFNSGLAADTAVYRIDLSVSAVPEPQTLALMLAGLLAVGALARRRRSGSMRD